MVHAPADRTSHSGNSRHAASSPHSPLSTPHSPRRNIFLPRIPTSPSIPSPSLSAPEVVDHIAFAISDHDKPESEGIIESFLADAGTINGTSATNQSIPALVSSMIPRGEIVQTFLSHQPSLEPGPPETFHTHILLIHNGGRQTRIQIHLARAASGPHQGAWLLTSLDNKPDSS